MPTGVGLVQVMKQAQAGEAADHVGGNDSTGPCGDVPLGRHRCTCSSSSFLTDSGRIGARPVLKRETYFSRPIGAI